MINTLINREELIKLLPKDSIGVEIGVFKGEFSKIILETVKPHIFYLVDPWEGDITSGDKNGENIEVINGPQYYLYNIIPNFLFIPQVKILRAYSDILTLFPDNYLDWVYIDGAHDYMSVKNDLEYIYPKIKEGGLITGHDYNKSSFPGLVQAVDEFCIKYNLNIKYLTQDKLPSFIIIKQ